jgi:hypothetical protein
MTESIPQIVAGIGDDGRPVVLVGETGQEAADIPSLRAVAPGLMQPAAALVLAEAVNHLAQGRAFKVIDDPAIFEANYRARLANEDPSQPWRQGVFRLIDYGMPDFSDIAAPKFNGQVLVYFAEDAQIGVPYRIELDVSTTPAVEDDSYRAMPLVPLDGDDGDEQPGEPSPDIKALQAQLAASPYDT